MNDPTRQSTGDEPDNSLFAGVGELCRVVARLTGVDGAALALMTTRGAVRELVYATDVTAQRLDELQFVLGEGPCLDSYAERRPYLCADLASGDGDRWPVFAGEVEALGVSALFAYPVGLAEQTLGVLELYRRAPGDLSDHQQQSAAICADAAAAAVHSNWQSYTVRHGHERPGDLGRDLAEDQAAAGDDTGSFSRSEVHLASGMVAVQLSITVDEALDRLRGKAFREGRSITDLADDIVQRRLTLTRDDEENS